MARSRGYRLPDGDSALHVDEERRGAAALRHQALALLLDLAGLLAVLAADRERKRPQAPLGNFFTAFEAVPVGALFQTVERFLDLAQRLRLHLDQGELDFVLNIRFGAFRGVQDTLDGAARALRSDIAHTLLDLAHHLAAALLENLPQLGVTIAVHLL